jgi:peptidoglycan hydrolase CwlO-like protein
MTKEELEKEAVTECFMLTVNTIGIDQRDVELAYVMGAEPREKRIAELETTNKRISNECHTLVDTLEKKQKEITELEEENAEAKNLIEELASSLSVVGECDEEECELINKAQKFINKPIF